MTTFTIANGASLSDSQQTEGALPVGIMMPDTWTGANLTFQFSLDGITFNNVYLEDDTEWVVRAAPSRCILFTNVSQLFALTPATYWKIRSGTSSVPVNQTGVRVLEVMVIA